MVFGLGIATVLTLIVTPSMLALRVWFSTYMKALGRLLARLTAGRSSRIARDMNLRKATRKMGATEIIWTAYDPDAPQAEPAGVPEDDANSKVPPEEPPLKAAE